MTYPPINIKPCQNSEVILTSHNFGKSVVVVGAGGHSRVVCPLIKLLGHHVTYLLDDNEKLHGKQVHGLLVKGNTDDLKNETDAFIAIGNNAIRKKIVESVDKKNYPSFIHPDALISSEAEIGEGTVIMAGAIIQPGSKIGDHVIVNSGVVIDHDCTLENYTQIAPSATLAGSCTLKEGAFMGVNACVIEGLTLGEWSVVGAAAAVISDIPEHCTAVGVPAKPIKFHNE